MFGIVKLVVGSAIGSMLGYKLLVFIEENELADKAMAAATDAANTALTNLGKVADLLQGDKSGSTTDD